MNKSDVIAIIRSLLTSTNSSYSVSLLNKDFKNETGFDIPLFGYDRISDFLYSIPDTVKVTGVYPVQQVSLVTNEKSGHIVSLVGRQKSPKQKTKQFSNKNISRKDVANVRNFSIKKPQNSKHLRKTTSDYFKGKTTAIRASALSPSKKSLAKANLLSSYTIENGVSLYNCLYVGESIPCIDMSLHARVGEYVEVCLGRIFNPQKFYFHFRKFKKKLTGFMNRLQYFYSTYENVPQLSDKVIKPKFVCAVFYKIYGEPMWHRAEICKIVDDFQVIVKLIDQGQRVRISKKKLKYLHRDFTSFPRQAFLGSLANIKPSKGNSGWSLQASRRFSDLAFQRDLIAGVVCIDTKRCCMRMALSCTQGLEIHINDTLVEEGYAEFTVNISNSHFAERLTAPDSWEASKNNFIKSESVIEKIYFNAKLAERISMSVESCVSTKLQTPVFYFYNNDTNNKRLKKLFSIAK